ncbi:GNAT family N-acetyltransferase [Candidatus Altiarchaeota archaeon]
MASELEDIGLKELGRFNRQVKEKVDDISSRKASKHDTLSELSIELDGISELTRIDPHKFLEIIKTSNPDYSQIVDRFRREALRKAPATVTDKSIASIVETMISLNLLKQHVFEAGSYEKALDHVADKYGVSQSQLTVRASKEELKVDALTDKQDVKEASMVITSFYGPKVAEELYSIFMISKVGRLLAVKDQYGKILGVIHLLFDRWGDSYIHAYCVLKNYRGFGVGDMLLEAVEEHSRGSTVWATRSLDMVYAMRNFFRRGYVGKTYIPDYWSEGNPRIVFEKSLARKQDLGDSLPDDIRHTDELDASLDHFSTSLANKGLLETALNEHGYEMIGFSDTRGDNADDMDTVILKKSEHAGVFQSREHALDLTEYPIPGFTAQVLSSYADIHEARALEERADTDPREDYGTFKMLTYMGLLVGVRDVDGNLAGLSGMVWDAGDGICMHALTCDPMYSGANLKASLIGYCMGIARKEGRRKLWLIHDIEDISFLEKLMNKQGFAARSEYLNPYDNGRNYLLLEKQLRQAERGSPDVSGVPIIRSFMEYKQEPQILIPSRNFGLVSMILKEGYAITGVIKSGESDQPLFLASKDI